MSRVYPHLWIRKINWNGNLLTSKHLKYLIFKNINVTSSQWQLSASYSSNKNYFKDIPSCERYPHSNYFNPNNPGQLVKSLSDAERKKLLLEIQKYQHSSDSNGSSSIDPSVVAKRQLKLLFLFNCAPFIGFGFLDNAIMILAGEYIDLTIGVTLGISTMAAAALGNLISDLAGVGLAGYVEILCSRMGLPVPDLTAQQLELTSSRVAAHLGKAVGIIIGCILGMFPLLFINNKTEAPLEN